MGNVQPLAFNVTLARTYRWQTESEREQANFVVSLIKLFRSQFRGAPLQVVGIRDPDAKRTLFLIVVWTGKHLTLAVRLHRQMSCCDMCLIYYYRICTAHSVWDG